jgi:cytochrome c-type biogenesis protein CcmH/NrfG
MSPARYRSTVLICGTIVFSVFIAYAHVVECGFISLDDDNHITQNPLVLKGLNWESVKSAFAAPRGSLWIPLTWISFMADVSVFGLNAAEMHAVNVLLHAANAVLLFLLLRRTTNRLWPSAAVAVLFALHPINVESVAWATERKNVLCLLFGLLSLHGYVSYAQRASKAAYAGALVLFGCALLSKPMLVPLPAGLLLFDLWPLRRLDWSNWQSRALEKLPFILLALGSSAITIRGSLNAGTSVTFDQLPLGLRAANAIVSYGTYLRQLVWPCDLCVLYPYRNEIEWLAAGISLIVLTAITIAAWRLRLGFPYLLAGWLWFLGMLVPTIGLVQVGSQARADRFTYAAQIGIYWAAIWLIADLWGERPRRWLAYAAAITCAALLMTTLRQVEYWTNGITLFEHTISVSDRNALAYAHAGFARAQLGDYSRAVSHYRMSLQLVPKFPKVWNLLTLALLQLNSNAEAADAAQQALALEPKNNVAHLNLATALERTGNDSQAISEYLRVVAADPTMAHALHRLGLLQARQGDIDAAIKSLKQAVRLRPDDAMISEALRQVSAGSKH